MGLYSRIVKRLCKPFMEMLHEELIYLGNNKKYNSNQIRKNLEKIKER
nr:hypothetical protein [Methanobrevibacter arboriphilus]